MAVITFPRQDIQVANQSAMLALIYETDVLIGDRAIIIGVSPRQVWELVDTLPSSLNSWRQLDGSSGGSVADATTGSKGIVQLGGDLAGTAAAPTVPALSGINDSINSLTTALSGKVDTGDGRLSNARTPIDGSVTTAKLASALLDQLATYYVKPGSGIPATDLTSALQTSLSGFYTKPSGGIPETDLTAAVQTKLNSGGGGGSLPFTFIAPSASTAGATDLAAINAAITTVSTAGGGTVALNGIYYINAPIQMKDNTTLLCFNGSVLLVAGSNSNVVINSNQNSTGNSNICIRGLGRFDFIGQVGSTLASAATAGTTSLQLNHNLPNGTYQINNGEQVTITNGNSTSASTAPYTATISSALVSNRSLGNGISSQVRNTTSLRSNIGFFFVNVNNLIVDGVGIGPTNAFAGNTQLCSNVRWRNIRLLQDLSSPNQDGLDVGPGCSNVFITNITGKTGDDFCSIYAQQTSGSLHPLLQTGSANNISNVYVSDIQVDIGITPLRLQAGDGFTLDGVHAENITNLQTTENLQPIIQLGTTFYVNTAPTAAQMKNISLSGYRGCARAILQMDSNFSNVHIKDVQIVGVWTRLLGYLGSEASFNLNSNTLTLEGVMTSNTANGGAVMATKAGGTLNSVDIRDIHITRGTAVTLNDGTVTKLSISNVHFDVLGGNPFRSTIAETGSIGNITYETSSGITARYATTMGMKMWGLMPGLSSADTTPTPAVGSVITCNNTKDPTGGAFASAAEYIGDGTVWNRRTTFATNFTP